jgi:hypothetical protein
MHIIGFLFYSRRTHFSTVLVYSILRSFAFDDINKKIDSKNEINPTWLLNAAPYIFYVCNKVIIPLMTSPSTVRV